MVSTMIRPSGRTPRPQGVSSSNLACCSRSPEGARLSSPIHAVDEPEPARVPARPLEITSAVVQAAQLDLCHRRNRLSPRAERHRCTCAVGPEPEIAADTGALGTEELR
jgi:hypothetical protein